MKAIYILILFISVCNFAKSEVTKKLQPLNTELIQSKTGLKGDGNNDEGVFKVSFPRNDLKVFIGKTSVTPPLGLTAWASFKRVDENNVMVMGDLVMTENQVNTVMDAALENDLEVTALHNHFFADKPKIMFMHIGGMGSEDQLSEKVGKVFNVLKNTIASKPEFKTGSVDPKKSKLNQENLDKIMGHKGKYSDGVFKFTIGRTTKMHGFDMGSAMGVNTWAAFAGTDKASVVDGDFAMLETELQAVLKSLRSSGIQIVAIHNHMTMEEPRFVFLHYWGVGPAESLAKGVKAALDTQKF